MQYIYAESLVKSTEKAAGSERLKALATATVALESAVHLAPDNAEYHHALAGVYLGIFRAGDAEREEALYQKLSAAQSREKP